MSHQKKPDRNNVVLFSKTESEFVRRIYQSMILSVMNAPRINEEGKRFLESCLRQLETRDLSNPQMRGILNVVSYLTKRQ